MAIGQNFQAIDRLQVAITTEASVGSGTKHASASWYNLPITAPPTINVNQVALDTGANQVGLYTPNHNQMKHRTDNPMWEITLEVLGTEYSLQTSLLGGLFKTNTEPVSLVSGLHPVEIRDGAVNTYAEHPTSVIVIRGANFEGTNTFDEETSVSKDLVYSGCVCKSASLSHSMDNGGLAKMTIVFVTGYKKGYTNNFTDDLLTTMVDNRGNSGVHFTDLSAMVGKFQGETHGSSNYDARAYGYNIEISRDVNRVGYTQDADKKPLAYNFSPYSVSGDVIVRSSSNQANIEPYYTNNQMSGFYLKSSGNYAVWLNGLVSAVSNDTGSPELRNTISFQGAGNLLLTDSFTSTADGGGGYTKVTSVGHGLSEGQYVTINSSTSLDGSYYIQSVNQDTFEVLNSWSTSTETGVWLLETFSKQIVSINLNA